MGKSSHGARRGAGSAGSVLNSTAANTAMRMCRQQKSRRRLPQPGFFCLAHSKEAVMGLFARFWHYSVETYGGAPVLLVINLIQLAVLGWVISQTLRAQADRAAPGLSADARRI